MGTIVEILRSTEEVLLPDGPARVSAGGGAGGSAEADLAGILAAGTSTVRTSPPARARWRCPQL